jgi:deoxyribodipyrimidine photo-lyase
MMALPISLYWFRQDLRLADNPALTAAAQAGTVIPVFILDDDHAGEHKMGGASRWWLHHSLIALNASLDGKLLVFKGRSGDASGGVGGCQRCHIGALEPLL